MSGVHRESMIISEFKEMDPATAMYALSLELSIALAAAGAGGRELYGRSKADAT